MKKVLIFLIIGWSFIEVSKSQKIIFLHHSTGANLFNEGNVSDWFINYNSNHNTNYQITERAFPDTPYPWDNYPYDYWNLWINGLCNSSNPKIECMNTLTQNYNIIIFKHCFPGADILADNGNADISSSTKTLANYKLQYRALRTMMDGYTNNKFIVWTLTPLHRLATNSANAARAKEFVDWVKTQWLTEDGKKHPNIFVFDFWGNMAETNTNPSKGQVNCLKYDYEGSHTDNDSHPNTLANQTVAPIFAQFVVNVINNTVTSVQPNLKREIKINFYDNSILNIEGIKDPEYPVQLSIFASDGKLISVKSLPNATSILSLKPGSYIITLKNQTFATNKKIVVTAK